MSPPPQSRKEDRLQAVILDVDGTLVDSERDGHRVAFNLAFEEAGLEDRWDVDRYGELLEVTGGRRRLNAYFEEENRAGEESRELAQRLHARKTEIFAQMAADGDIEPRPGVSELLDELTAADVRLAVATTGSREWVHPLLDRLFDIERFEVVVTREEAPDLKPDPSAHRLALERLGLPAAAAPAVEDSLNGLQAAKAAGLACVIVVNDYTRDQDFSGADLVLDGFGTADAEASVLADPHALNPGGRLDVDTLSRLAGTLSRPAGRE